jgi:RES domain-containing protein
MAVIRLHRKQRLASNYDGSLLYAGRWNPAGTPMLYASTSLSLACLEILVHLSPRQTPLDYVCSRANFGPLGRPEAEYFAVTDFRGDLRDVDSTRRAGLAWAMQRHSVALLVPSVIIPTEMNVLLNPLHPAFEGLAWSAPEPFQFDQRLQRGTVL